jgi:3-methyladenine DNA glycosylase AlkD
MSRARAQDARLLSTPVVLAELHARAQPARLGGMARVGIRTERALGVSTRSGQDDMERWAADFDSWDVCDQVCGNLCDRTPFAVAEAFAWSEREPEFMKRAAFSLMACLAARRDMRDAELASFPPVIERQSTDERNAVKKGVNWALRQIGKRSPGLNRRAVASAGGFARASRDRALDRLRRRAGADQRMGPAPPRDGAPASRRARRSRPRGGGLNAPSRRAERAA